MPQAEGGRASHPRFPTPHYTPADLPNNPDFPQTTAKRFLESQRAQRDGLDQQIAALKAQRQALDALIEPLEQQLGTAADEHPDTPNAPPQPYPEQPPDRPITARKPRAPFPSRCQKCSPPAG